jgi:enoyl-CoA hydratase/carnithine racemase
LFRRFQIREVIHQPPGIYEPSFCRRTGTGTKNWYWYYIPVVIVPTSIGINCIVTTNAKQLLLMSLCNVRYSKTVRFLCGLRRPIIGRLSSENTSPYLCVLHYTTNASDNGIKAKYAALRKRAVYRSGAPPSVGLIKDVGIDTSNTPAFIREVGCTRRVFLLEPYMTTAELEGFAYRIKVLTKNDSINSLLIATDNTDDKETGALPSSLIDRDYSYLRDDNLDDELEPAPGKTYHVAGGYDPLQVFRDGKQKDYEFVSNLLRQVRTLASAIMGDSQKTKIPTIFVPHGMVTDGGCAYLFASYVLTTRQSCMRILNPSRGLSFDPIGFSYTLPRLGAEFDQAAARFPGSCGLILGLMGYEANSDDMIETGLATNAMETPTGLGILEHTLSQLKPWCQQGLIKNPIKFYGEPTPTIDHNAQFRNVAVSDTIHCLTSYRADGKEIWSNNPRSPANNFRDLYDPSLDVADPIPFFAPRTSDLVDYAATFHEIFSKNLELPKLYEALKDIANRPTAPNSPNRVQREVKEIAVDFVKRLDRQSPLAVSVVYRLLRLGAGQNETIRSCAGRELNAQINMFASDDFQTWAEHAMKHGSETPYTGKWKHENLSQVTHDEVTEVIESDRMSTNQSLATK